MSLRVLPVTYWMPRGALSPGVLLASFHLELDDFKNRFVALCTMMTAPDLQLNLSPVFHREIVLRQQILLVFAYSRKAKRRGSDGCSGVTLHRDSLAARSNKRFAAGVRRKGSA
jgi:hypothetical protein